MTELRIATRASQLATTQSLRVASLIEGARSDITTTLVEIATTGDVDRTSPVTALTEMGAFVRAVQAAVLDGRADMAVHSCKDLPTAVIDGLSQWYPERDVPWDVMVGAPLDGLAGGARVGTGSPRRSAQLLMLRPDLEVVPVRGNVGTRVGMVASGDLHAVVLAEAGLRRIGLDGRVDHRFSLEEMVPAPGQAALCVEAMPGTLAAEVLDSIDDPAVRRAVETERRLLAVTGAGCRSALGALAVPDGDDMLFTTFVEDADGPRRAVTHGSDADALVAAARRDLGL